jgi:hypothetical protein
MITDYKISILYSVDQFGPKTTVWGKISEIESLDDHYSEGTVRPHSFFNVGFEYDLVVRCRVYDCD